MMSEHIQAQRGLSDYHNNRTLFSDSKIIFKTFFLYVPCMSEGSDMYISINTVLQCFKAAVLNKHPINILNSVDSGLPEKI